MRTYQSYFSENFLNDGKIESAPELSKCFSKVLTGGGVGGGEANRHIRDYFANLANGKVAHVFHL